MVKIELHELRRELQLGENENNKNTKSNIRRGDIYWVNLGEPKGNIQGGIRPCIVTSNDIGNKFSPIVSIAPLSTHVEKCKLPTHVFVGKDECLGLTKDSFLMAEQIRPVDKKGLGDYIGYIMNDRIDKAISISLGVNKEIENIINRKLDTIEFLDEFIYNWIDKEKDISLIEDTIDERELRIKDLKFYCIEHGKDIKDYYKYSEVSLGHNTNKKVEMVG